MLIFYCSKMFYKKEYLLLLTEKMAEMFWGKKLLKFLPCFPYWKGRNVPPRDSQCLLKFSQPVGLSYCLTFSPHLFFFNSHRAPNRILFPLKMETLLGPCNILTHLESWEPALTKITFFLWLIPLDFFLTSHLLFVFWLPDVVIL